MSALKRFNIPIRGLKTGFHEYEFSIDQDFFSNFEGSPIQKGKFEVKFILDKREDMLVLTFDFKGSTETECDRCLSNINLPMQGNEDLIVKYADEANEEDVIIYISRETTELNVAKYLYESIILVMPVTNVYDCEEEKENVCDLEMLEYLENKTAAEEQEEKPSEGDSPWDILKDLNKN